MSSNGSHCGPPRPHREAATSGSDGISSASARARIAVTYFLIDGFRGFCVYLRVSLHIEPPYFTCFRQVTNGLYPPGFSRDRSFLWSWFRVSAVSRRRVAHDRRRQRLDWCRRHGRRSPRKMGRVTDLCVHDSSKYEKGADVSICTLMIGNHHR